MSRILYIYEVIDTTCRHHRIEATEARKFAIATACALTCKSAEEIIDSIKSALNE